MRRAQSGRLLELPILGAILVVVGVGLGRYHPAGFVVAALPILIWFSLSSAGFVLRMRTRLRRGRIVRRQLAALRAEGFAAKVICKGDLGRGTVWVVFDLEKAKVLSEEGARAHALTALAPPFIDEARRLGDPNPLYYVVRLQFGADGADLVTTRRREAERWVKEIAALTAPTHHPSPTGVA